MTQMSAEHDVAFEALDSAKSLYDDAVLEQASTYTVSVDYNVLRQHSENSLVAIQEIDSLKAQLGVLVGKFNAVLEEQEMSQSISTGIDVIVAEAQEALINAEQGLSDTKNALAQIIDVIENPEEHQADLALDEWLTDLVIPDDVATGESRCSRDTLWQEEVAGPEGYRIAYIATCSPIRRFRVKMEGPNNFAEDYLVGGPDALEGGRLIRNKNYGSK